MNSVPRAPHARLPGRTIDRGLLFLLLGALLLIVIGLVSIPLLAGRTPSLAPETTPEGVVQRFYAAAYRGDYQAAYGYVSADAQRRLALADLQQQISSDLQKSQARVGTASINGASASVRVTFTHFEPGGLFGSQEWSFNREVLLQREGDAWKIIGGAFYPVKIARS
jgi:hypothetical protein